MKTDRRNGMKEPSRRAEASALYDDQTDLQKCTEQAFTASESALLQSDDAEFERRMQATLERHRQGQRERMKEVSDLLIPSDHDGDEVQYWREFQAYYLDHYDPTIWTDRTVNGISIFCDRFAERVIESLFKNRFLIVR